MAITILEPSPTILTLFLSQTRNQILFSNKGLPLDILIVTDIVPLFA